MLSFWLARRLAMPPASRERAPCCWPMVPRTTGASIPSNELLAPWPSPANLPTAPASADWSRSPTSDESICDPFSISEVSLPAPTMLAKLPSVSLAALRRRRAFALRRVSVATPLNTASSAGTAALMAVCTRLRSRPRAEASARSYQVRNCMISETRLVAMGLSLPVTVTRSNLENTPSNSIRPWSADINRGGATPNFASTVEAGIGNSPECASEDHLNRIRVFPESWCRERRDKSATKLKVTSDEISHRDVEIATLQRGSEDEQRPFCVAGGDRNPGMTSSPRHR